MKVAKMEKIRRNSPVNAQNGSILITLVLWVLLYKFLASFYFFDTFASPGCSNNVVWMLKKIWTKYEKMWKIPVKMLKHLNKCPDGILSVYYRLKRVNLCFKSDLLKMFQQKNNLIQISVDSQYSRNDK